MQKSIGIIGGGVVGQAVKSFYDGTTSVKVYDKFKTMNTWEETVAQDVIYICVPTPYDNGFDLSVVDEVLQKLSLEQGKIVVIKSTVIVGTTDALQLKYPNL